MSSFNGDFKEYALTGTLFVLPAAVFLLIKPEIIDIELISYLCRFSFLKPMLDSSISGSIVDGIVFIFKTTIIALASVIIISIGFILNLSGSLVFGLEATILGKIIEKHKNHFFFEKYHAHIKGDICLLDKRPLKDIWKQRRAAMNIENLLLCHCSENTTNQENIILRKKMSSIQIVRGISYSALYVFLLYFIILYKELIKLESIGQIVIFMLLVVFILVISNSTIERVISNSTIKRLIRNRPEIRRETETITWRFWSKVLICWFLIKVIIYYFLVLVVYSLVLVVLILLSSAIMIYLFSSPIPEMNTAIGDLIYLIPVWLLLGFIYFMTKISYSDYIQTLLDMTYVQNKKTQ